jgi:hypothetical protein
MLLIHGKASWTGAAYDRAVETNQYSIMGKWALRRRSRSTPAAGLLQAAEHFLQRRQRSIRLPAAGPSARTGADLTHLRAALPEHLVPEHVTVGRLVLYDRKVLSGAGPSTLEAVPIAFIVSGPGSYAPALGAVVRDRHALFVRSERNRRR